MPNDQPGVSSNHDGSPPSNSSFWMVYDSVMIVLISSQVIPPDGRPSEERVIKTLFSPFSGLLLFLFLSYHSNGQFPLSVQPSCSP